MSRRNASNPISLFPFLAVLVSTMGALILLLLVLTRQAQLSRDAAAVRSDPANAPALPPLPAEQSWPEVLPPPPVALEPVRPPVGESLPTVSDPAPELLRRRQQLERRLSERRASEHRHLQEHARIHALAERIAESKRRLDALSAVRKERVGHIERLYSTLEDRRVERQKHAAKAGSRYAIVAYSGPNGTRQRPVFLECTSDAIILQPEGVRIGAELLLQPENPANPLALVVAALVDALRSDAANGSPYPLFVVRPAGIAGYYLARQALAHLELPSGYELVDDAVSLEYPPASDRLRELAEAALRTAPRPLAALARSRPTVLPPPSVEPAVGNSSGRSGSSGPRLLPPQSGSFGGVGTSGNSQSGARRGNRAGPHDLSSTPTPPPVTFDKLFFAAHEDSEPGESSLILPEAGERGTDENFMGLPVAPRWFRREIGVDCHGKELVLGLGGERVALGPHDAIAPAVAAVLGYAKSEIDRWRRAGQLHQFRPVLVFRVHPDGLENYYRMRLALRKSNVSVEHRLADAQPADWTLRLGANHAPQTR